MATKSPLGSPEGEQTREFENKVLSEWKIAEETGNYRDYLVALDNYLTRGAMATIFTGEGNLGDTMDALTKKITPILIKKFGEDYVESVDKNMITENGLDIPSIELLLGKGHSKVKEVSQQFAKSILEGIDKKATKH